MQDNRVSHTNRNTRARERMDVRDYRALFCTKYHLVQSCTELRYRHSPKPHSPPAQPRVGSRAWCPHSVWRLQAACRLGQRQPPVRHGYAIEIPLILALRRRPMSCAVEQSNWLRITEHTYTFGKNKLHQNCCQRRWMSLGNLSSAKKWSALRNFT